MTNKQYPKTLPELVETVLKDLSKSEIDDIALMSKNHFCTAGHFSLGMQIRNEYIYQNPHIERLEMDFEKMVNGNDYIEGYHTVHPDDMSGIVLGMVWDFVMEAWEG